MKHKRRIIEKLNPKINTRKNTSAPTYPWIMPLLALSLILNLFFVYRAINPSKTIDEILTHAVSKAAYSVSSSVVLRDVENPSFRIRVGEVWDHKTQRMSGQVALIPLEQFPSLAMIIDHEARIVSMNLTSPLRLGGSTIQLNQYFARFYGLGLEALAGNNGIFKPDEQELTRFSDHFKDALLKSMQMLYIKTKGKDQFDQQFPNGIHLASTGDLLKSFQAMDTKGNTLSLQDLRQQNTALIYVDTSCGACEVKCSLIRDLALEQNLKVIFITTGDEEQTTAFSQKYGKEERVIQDSDGKLARLLYLGDPPALMLIDKNLKILHKGYVGDVAKDAEPFLKLFSK
jgi:peroxiredoxin